MKRRLPFPPSIGSRATRSRGLVALLACAALSSACVGAPTGPTDAVPAQQAENARRDVNRGGLVPPGANDADTLAAIVEAVRTDAARAAGGRAEPKTLAIDVAEATWGDSSLGCPQPGLMYLQALVPGWRIVVRGAGGAQVYHASRRGQWLWCPAERAQPPRGAGPVTH
jgi:hypothetical protein